MSSLAQTLKGLKEAKVSKKGSFLSEGRYVLKIKNTLVISPFEGPQAFVVEAEVIASSNPEHPVGVERSWFQSFKYRDSAFSEMKKFTYAALKLDPANPAHKKKIEDEVDPQIEPMLEKVITENRFAGVLVNCEVSDRESKKVNPKTGETGTYSQYSFTPHTPAS